MGTVFIYGLFDPTNGRIRYVGKTVDLQKRLRTHVQRPRNTHVSCWIRGLKAIGLKPHIVALEIIKDGSDLDWQETERTWIDSLKRAGANLTNLMDGGHGGSRHSEETKAKIRKAVRGRKMPPEHGLKISAAKMGQKYNLKTRTKPPFTAEHRRNMSIARRAMFARMDKQRCLL